MKPIIQSEWLSFVEACELQDAPAVQLREMRNAFFAGALAVFAALVDDAANDVPEEAVVDKLESIKRELEAFNRGLQQNMNRSN